MALEYAIITDDSTPTTLLTVPAEKEYAITTMIVCNTTLPDPEDPTAGTAYFDMHLVPQSSDPVGDVIPPLETQVIKDLYLEAGETFTFDSEKLVLGPEDKIVFVSYSVAGGGSLSATVSYLEI
jgi:hypothetical protein